MDIHNYCISWNQNDYLDGLDGAGLLDKFWRISLHVTDDAIAKLYSMWRKA